MTEIHDPPLKIKVVIRGEPTKGAKLPLARHLLDGWAKKRGFVFKFDSDERDYDWLVVYEDLPMERNARRYGRVEALACPPENTILMTCEPSSVKLYSRTFVRQFGHVITSQEPFALHHPGRVWRQVGLAWFYRNSAEQCKTASEISCSYPEKTATISTVCSTKRNQHTLHRLRYDFTEYASKALPEMEIFGHGRRFMADKVDAIDRFKYHLCIENHIAPHHITEKLSDPFLGLSLPFYFGAPNTNSYFPEESFIPIDIRKPEEAINIIRAAIASNEYEKRLPAIIEARRRVIEDYNMFTVIADVIDRSGPGGYRPKSNKLKSHRAARVSAPLTAITDMVFREALQLKNRINNLMQG